MGVLRSRVSKGQTYLRGLGQRLRGEEKHAELECCRNTAVCIKEGMSISTYTHYSMFRDVEWYRLNNSRLGMSSELCRSHLFCTSMRNSGASIRKIMAGYSPHRPWALACALEQVQAFTRYTYYISEWNVEELILSLKSRQCLDV